MRKILSLFLLIALTVALTACGKKDDEKGSVYLLNFKPESDKVFKALAYEYEELTGVDVKIKTAAAGTYEETLTAEMLKPEKPTLFSINGPVGLGNWENYTLALEDTKKAGYEEFTTYQNLSDKTLASAVSKDGHVYGLPITVEGYGLVYNKTVFTDYFNQVDKTSPLSSVNDIDSFAKLKVIVEDLTHYANGTKPLNPSSAAIAGLDGVFAPVALKSGHDWPYHTHLSNIPFAYEFMETDVKNPLNAGLGLDSIQFKYNNEMKNIFDLFVNNNSVAKNTLGTKTYDDSVVAFATEKAAIIQQGNWVYSAIQEADGKTIEDSELGMMPIYTGHTGEDEYTIPVGTENFWSINKKASKADINETIKFVNWLFSDENAKQTVKNDLGFMAPFTTFGENDLPENPLAQAVLRLSSVEGKSIIPWVFGAYPSQDWKNQFGGDLLEYVNGNKTWDQVVSETKSGW